MSCSVFMWPGLALGGGVSCTADLTVANSSSATSGWSDSGGSIVLTIADTTAGINNTAISTWPEWIAWDITDRLGKDVLVSGSPSLALDRTTTTHPGQAMHLAFGFATAANLGALNIAANSRVCQSYNDGLTEEGILARRNDFSAAVATLRAAPALTRCQPLLMNDGWRYLTAALNHGDTGNNPLLTHESSGNALTSTDRIFAFMAGGVSVAATAERTWASTLKVGLSVLT